MRFTKFVLVSTIVKAIIIALTLTSTAFADALTDTARAIAESPATVQQLAGDNALVKARLAEIEVGGVSSEERADYNDLREMDRKQAAILQKVVELQSQPAPAPATQPKPQRPAPAAMATVAPPVAYRPCASLRPSPDGRVLNGLLERFDGIGGGVQCWRKGSATARAFWNTSTDYYYAVEISGAPAEVRTHGSWGPLRFPVSVVPAALRGIFGGALPLIPPGQTLYLNLPLQGKIRVYKFVAVNGDLPTPESPLQFQGATHEPIEYDIGSDPRNLELVVKLGCGGMGCLGQ